MMRTSRILLFLCTLCCLYGSMALAADAAYHLGAEDTITVHVLKHVDFSGDFLIPPDGIVDFPGVGKLNVSGLTTDDVANLVRERLSARLRHPEVSVILRSPRMQRIYLLGAVERPGIYDLKSNWRVTEAIAAAGGLNAEPQDHTVTLLRAQSGEQLALNLVEILAAKPEANILLAPNDVLTVGVVQKIPVYVMGMVAKPGVYQLKPGEGLVEAVALAGGVSQPREELTATIQRGDTALPADFERQTPLRQGDIVNISSQRSVRVMVTGQVKNQGFYDLKAQQGVLEALALAGGADNNAALTRITIVRANGKTEQVNLSPALTDADPELNVSLCYGDLVLVPENTNNVTVLGFVKQPGRYVLRDGKSWRLVDAVGLAGGQQDKRAGITKVALVRVGQDGQQSRQVIDLAKFYNTGDLAYNPEIRGGDIVYVPETSRPDWSTVFQALTSLSVLGNALIP